MPTKAALLGHADLSASTNLIRAAVAQAGGVRAAARMLGISHSTVSEHLHGRHMTLAERTSEKIEAKLPKLTKATLTELKDYSSYIRQVSNKEAVVEKLKNRDPVTIGLIEERRRQERERARQFGLEERERKYQEAFIKGITEFNEQ
jgi:predicted transcriptional regulator